MPPTVKRAKSTRSRTHLPPGMTTLHGCQQGLRHVPSPRPCLPMPEQFGRRKPTPAQSRPHARGNRGMQQGCEAAETSSNQPANKGRGAGFEVARGGHLSPPANPLRAGLSMGRALTESKKGRHGQAEHVRRVPSHPPRACTAATMPLGRQPWRSGLCVRFRPAESDAPSTPHAAGTVPARRLALRSSSPAALNAPPQEAGSVPVSALALRHRGVRARAAHAQLCEGACVHASCTQVCVCSHKHGHSTHTLAPPLAPPLPCAPRLTRARGS